METRTSERGAILIHVAIGILILIAINAFVVDYGVMWVGRGQAQNAADAGALAGAVAMAFDPGGWTNRTPTGPARLAARQTALSNFVWGQAPDVNIVTDVNFTNQPADRCVPDAAGNTPCIRVDVYRNQARGNALPALFGVAVGLVEQGVRATATARVAVANASDCLKPWAIPDKWFDAHDITAPTTPVNTWTADDTFDTHLKKGNSWIPLPTPDVYTKPTATSPGTGFTVAADLGLQVVLKQSSPQDAVAPGWFFPVRLPRYDGPSAGGDDYRENIATCNGLPIEIGDTLQSENGNMIGPTKQGVEDLIELDPDAEWDPASKSVINSCAQASTPCATRSPRIVAIPIFDTGAYFAGKMNGKVTLTIVNILGFFIADMQGNNVVGYLTEVPGLVAGDSSIDPTASFMSQIQLVR
jgi:putative Flp pilus-assembly TadE/G-like protein